MLTDDATIAMPPISTWYSGRDAVAGFLRGWPLGGEPRWRLVPAGANGQPAFGHYLWDGATNRFMPHSINLLTLRGGRISDITAFLTPEAFSRFGLPDGLPDDPT
jgi:RNA polymerase sigma-70 factor (ECF subfamily)